MFNSAYTKRASSIVMMSRFLSLFFARHVFGRVGNRDFPGSGLTCVFAGVTRVFVGLTRVLTRAPNYRTHFR